jgi:hypothetical protein
MYVALLKIVKRSNFSKQNSGAVAMTARAKRKDTALFFHRGMDKTRRMENKLFGECGLLD